MMCPATVLDLLKLLELNCQNGNSGGEQAREQVLQMATLSKLYAASTVPSSS